MITIKITDRGGQTFELEMPTDMNLSLMEALKAHEVDIKATCGGMALCSTCHVYIESDHKLTEMPEAEEDMLDMAFDVQDNSRLACQLRVKEELDGLEIRLAPQELES